MDPSTMYIMIMKPKPSSKMASFHFSFLFLEPFQNIANLRRLRIKKAVTPVGKSSLQCVMYNVQWLLCSFTAFQTFDCCSILFRLTLNDDHVVFWAAKNLWGVDVLREHHEQHDEGDHGEEDHGHVVGGGRLQHQVASIVHMWRRRWGHCRDCNNILKKSQRLIT